MPNTKGIGQVLLADLTALPKSKDAGELNEKSEEESPSSLRFLVFESGDSEGTRRWGSSDLDVHVDAGNLSESFC